MLEVEGFFLINNLKFHVFSSDIGIFNANHLILVILFLVFHLTINIRRAKNEIFDSINFKVPNLHKLFFSTWREALWNHLFEHLKTNFVYFV